MNYFYFGTRSIFNVPANIDRVDVADTPVGELIYVTSIDTKNMFIVKSYDFNTLICHATTEKHLEDIKELRRSCSMPNTHIIVTNIDDKAEVLFNVNADTDLGVTVHFLEQENDLEKLIIRLIRQ